MTTDLRFNTFASAVIIGQQAKAPNFIPKGTPTWGGRPSIATRLELRLRVPVAPNKRNPAGCIYVTVQLFGEDATRHHSAMAEAFAAQQWVVASCEYNEWLNRSGRPVPYFVGHSVGVVGDRHVARERPAKTPAPGYEPDAGSAANHDQDAPDEAPWDSSWPDAEPHDADAKEAQ